MSMQACTFTLPTRFVSPPSLPAGLKRQPMGTHQWWSTGHFFVGGRDAHYLGCVEKYSAGFCGGAFPQHLAFILRKNWGNFIQPDPLVVISFL